MMKKVGIIKRMFALLLVFLLSINSFAAVVSDNDGSAFITKAEFDSLKNNFQAQIDQYNQSIDSKIDGAIASYLAGIKLSTQENVPIISLGFKHYEIRDQNSDDSALLGNPPDAVSISYNWKYAAMQSTMDDRCISLARVTMAKTGTPAYLNGIKYENGNYIYAGYRKYVINKTSDLFRIYKGNGANTVDGVNNTIAAVMPSFSSFETTDGSGSWATDNYYNSNLHWETFKTTPSVGGAASSSYFSDGLIGTGFRNTNYNQCRKLYVTSGASAMSCDDSDTGPNYHITSHAFQEFSDPENDRLINVFGESKKSVMYSLNKWDGMGFRGYLNGSVASWVNDFNLKLQGWNTARTNPDVCYDLEIVPGSHNWTCTKCPQEIKNVAISNIDFSEVRYEVVPNLYSSSGVLTETPLTLNSNLPLVNINKDGVLKIVLEFNNAMEKKIWLDTVPTTDFTTIRSTNLTPIGYVLDSSGAFSVIGSLVELDVPVSKNTTIMIKIGRSSSTADCILTLPDYLTLTVAN